MLKSLILRIRLWACRNSIAMELAHQEFLVASLDASKARMEMLSKRELCLRLKRLKEGLSCRT